MSTFLPRRSGFHHGGRFSRLHSVISRSNQHVYSTHYTSSCTPHVSIISREQVMSFGYDQIEQILNWCGYNIPEKLQNFQRSKINRNSIFAITSRIFYMEHRKDPRNWIKIKIILATNHSTSKFYVIRTCKFLNSWCQIWTFLVVNFSDLGRQGIANQNFLISID